MQPQIRTSSIATSVPPSHLATMHMYQYLQQCVDAPASINLSSDIHKQNLNTLSRLFHTKWSGEAAKTLACKQANVYLNSEFSGYRCTNVKERNLAVLGVTLDEVLHQVKNNKVNDIQISTLYLLVSLLGWQPSPCDRVKKGQVENCVKCLIQETA